MNGQGDMPGDEIADLKPELLAGLDKIDASARHCSEPMVVLIAKDVTPDDRTRLARQADGLSARPS